MADLLKKVQTLISANMHAMVDSALKSNSLAVYDEYVRQVEDNLDRLREAEATVGADVKTLRRKKTDSDQKAAELDRNIDIFLREGKEELALAAQGRLNSVTRLSQSYDTMIERQESEYSSLKNARLKLEAKLTDVRQQRDEMQALLDLARSKELQVKTMKSLDDLMGAGDADVANFAESIRQRLDVATARSEMMASDLEKQMDDILERGTLEAQLAERKARLGMSE